MDTIKQLMKEKRWTVRALSEKLGCTRYLLQQIIDSEPGTAAQRALANEAIAFLNTGSPAPAPATGIPFYGEIPAGPLSFMDNEIDPDKAIPMSDLDPRTHFALRVHGSSMEPVYQDDDIVICRRVEDVAMPRKTDGPTPFHKFARFDGRVVCALVDETETTLKRLEITKTGVDDTQYFLNLRPLNPNHPIIPIIQNNSLAIKGEVVRIIRNV
jgi:SOS-response transcriptional repressor LexA